MSKRESGLWSEEREEEKKRREGIRIRREERGPREREMRRVFGKIISPFFMFFF